MSRDICFCYEDDSVESAAKLMEEKQIRRLAVFDRSPRLSAWCRWATWRSATATIV